MSCDSSILSVQAKRQQALLHDLGRDIVTVVSGGGRRGGGGLIYCEVVWCVCHLLQTKSRDREARQYYKTLQQQRTVADHLRTQEGEDREQRKRLRELEGQLKDFAEAYEVVKAERNRIHAQIQVSRRDSKAYLHTLTLSHLHR